MVTVKDGEGHGVYLLSGNACADALEKSSLITGKLAVKDTVRAPVAPRTSGTHKPWLPRPSNRFRATPRQAPGVARHVAPTSNAPRASTRLATSTRSVRIRADPAAVVVEGGDRAHLLVAEPEVEDVDVLLDP
ncbi:hypothetical protein EES43_00570 [Streptomyces sp. ADI96-02]|nr:hypothetical protein EES43_00570 [Streptomyces sp. ADI96-02]